MASVLLSAFKPEKRTLKTTPFQATEWSSRSPKGWGPGAVESAWEGNATSLVKPQNLLVLSRECGKPEQIPLKETTRWMVFAGHSVSPSPIAPPRKESIRLGRRTLPHVWQGTSWG